MSNANKNKSEEGQVPVNSTCPNPVPAPAVDPAAEAAKIISDAEAKAAAIVAEAEAKVKAAAEAKATGSQANTAVAPKGDPMEELVPYTAPLLPHLKKRDILVGVNGELIRIKRGEPVQIKRKHFNAIQNAAAQEFAALEAREEIKKQGEKALASM